MKSPVLILALGSFLVSNIAADDACVPKTAEYGTVCVCNSTYCDTAGSLPELGAGEYAIITTSESGQRFNVTTGTTVLSPIPHHTFRGLEKSVKAFLSSRTALTYITLSPNITYQEIEGFGGAFTDAATINIANISTEAQELLMKSYFGTDGLDYNLARVPIGGTDFSTHEYAYNEYPLNDTCLSNFTLSEEDNTLKIPLILLAKQLASDDIRIHAATWSPPVWMKTNNKINGYSELKKEYYETYALYHLKFVEEYAKQNVTIYALSTGNEPVTGNFADAVTINSLGWAAEDQADWIVNHFGPMIRESSYSDTKIYLLDDNIAMIDDMLTIIAENEYVSEYMDGVAVHWYMDSRYPVSIIEKVYELFGNISVINTEACVGFRAADKGLQMGKWSRAEFYMQYVIEKLNYNVNGWIDWNLAVNTAGGPKWNSGSIDAFIIVDAENDQFYKEPMYYAYGHITKYVPRGSMRIGSDSINEIPNVAFQRPDGMIVVVAMNNDTVAKTMRIDDIVTGQFLNFTMEANSISTVVYNPENLLVDSNNCTDSS